MSLDKAIEHKKERRKQFQKSKAFDRTCRNHGSCPYCESNRTIQAQKEQKRIESFEETQEKELSDSP
jgi:hypothetical protein